MSLRGWIREAVVVRRRWERGVGGDEEGVLVGGVGEG